jgi:hypothetical protein
MEDWFHRSPRGARAVVPCAIPGGAAAVRGDVSVLVRGDCILPPAGAYERALAAWAAVANTGVPVDATPFRAWLERHGEQTVEIQGETFNAALVREALEILPCPAKLTAVVRPVPNAGGRSINALFMDGPDWRIIVAPVGFADGARPRGFPSWPIPW